MNNFNAATSNPQCYQRDFQTTADTAALSMAANVSTNLSFVITLTQDQAKVFLGRAKRMHKAGKDCQQLTQDVVQAVNSAFADIKHEHVKRLFVADANDADATKRVERTESMSRTAAAEAGIDLSAFGPAAVDAVRPRKDQRRVPWEQLHERTRYRRLQTATDAFRNSFWPFLMAALSASWQLSCSFGQSSWPSCFMQRWR